MTELEKLTNSLEVFANASLRIIELVDELEETLKQPTNADTTNQRGTNEQNQALCEDGQDAQS